MSFLSKLKSIFGSNEDSNEVATPVVQQTPIEENREIRGECYYCKINNTPSNVYMEQPWSKQQGKLFHRECYKQAKKDARGSNILP